MLSLSKKELELRSRACMLLEKTKLQAEKYTLERKKLFELEYVDVITDTDFSYWDNIISRIEDLVLLDEKLSSFKNDSDYLHSLSCEMKNQKIRSTDVVHTIGLFKVTTADGDHFFLTRCHAEKFLKENKNQKLEIVECHNLELENLLKIIERIF